MPAHATDDGSSGLSPEDLALLGPDAARADHERTAARVVEQRQALDFAGWADRAAAHSRPHRERRERERSERQRLIDDLRAQRVYERNLQLGLDAIPPRYGDAAVDHPDVARWVHERAAGLTRESLLLMGHVGTGKTHQAFAAFRELVRAGAGRPAAVTVPALLDALRPGRPGEVNYQQIETADLLLLDDFAAERVTDWTGETLYRLIDSRWSSMRCTIITTNATPADVRERLGDRIASRLGGMCRVVTMTGRDRRLHSI